MILVALVFTLIFSRPSASTWLNVLSTTSSTQLPFTLRSCSEKNHPCISTPQRVHTNIAVFFCHLHFRFCIPAPCCVNILCFSWLTFSAISRVPYFLSQFISAMGERNGGYFRLYINNEVQINIFIYFNRHYVWLMKCHK